MPLGDLVLYSLYVYAPNHIAPVIFTIAYAISAAFHLWQGYRYNAFNLMWLQPACAVLFAAGYALRIFGSQHYLYSETDMTPLLVFIMSQVFIYVCPPLLELSNYQVLGRTFYYVPHCSPLPPGRVLAIFGGIMALIELLNALGVTLSANPSSSSSTQSIGSHISIAAIVLQLVVILTFVCMAFLFHHRVLEKMGSGAGNVMTLLRTLYISMSLIFVRCIYRLVEHTGNTNVTLDDMASLRRLSPILRYEAFFYVFEASLMLVNSVLWNVWNPARFLPRDYNVYLAQDGSEVEGREVKDGRSVVARIGNVLTFGILFRRRKEVQGLEELSDVSSSA